MQHIYIPRAFAELAGNDAFGSWFRIARVTFVMNGKTKSYTLQELSDAGVLSVYDEDEYAIDVESLMRKDATGLVPEGLVSTYAMSSATDTLGTFPPMKTCCMPSLPWSRSRSISRRSIPSSTKGRRCSTAASICLPTSRRAMPSAMTAFTSTVPWMISDRRRTPKTDGTALRRRRSAKKSTSKAST